MTPDRWQKAKGLFDAVLKLPPDDRLHFLDANDDGDAEVRLEVESLLSISEEAAGFLEQPVVREVADAITAKPECLRPGQIVSHYKIIRLLGSGGMGDVYLAEDTRLLRQVALKTLSEYSSSNHENHQRFLREVHSASALNHPNICTIHEVNDYDGSPFIAMEYIPGETLDRKIKAGMDPSQVVDVALQVADALGEAHAHNIVHRDIKPANIMVTPRGQVKVLDFGLAKKLSADSEDEAQKLISRSGVIIGTASYMSPEQARGTEVDVRTDIFSFGIVLYEMTAGRPPFDGENVMDVISSILNKEPAPLLAGFPSGLEGIISKALRKDREERYQTAKDLRVDLKGLKQDLEFQNNVVRTASPNREQPASQTIDATTAGNVANTTSSAEYISGEIKKHKFTVLAFLALLVLAVGASGFWYFNNRVSRASQIESIAVLPFQNGSGDSNLDYLSDGMSESLIDRLSDLPDLKVIARSSSFKYRGENIDLQDAASKLGVQAIITGRLVRRGDDLSIRVEMIDVTNDRQLWSEQYNRRATDSLTLQQEIAQTVSRKLRSKLSGAQEQELAKQDTVNPQAYELLLRGRFVRLKRAGAGGGQNHTKAIEYFQQAVDIDPNYALAHFELSFTYNLIGEYDKSDAEARKALELDENLAEGHVAQAVVRQNAWDWANAESEFQRALDLNPNLAQAHMLYSGYLSIMGRHEESIAEAKRGKELDPLNPRINVNYGAAYSEARQYDQAIEIVKKTFDLDPNFIPAHWALAWAYSGKGMYEEALAEFQEAERLAGTSGPDPYLGAAYAAAGRSKEAQAILRQLESTQGDFGSIAMAVLYTSLGEREKAFVMLEKAFAARNPRLQDLKIEQGLDPLQDDPRFQDLLRRVGLSQ